ncbi:hypothetical protein RISK_002924 [Rhodopirellula islandica]|uniref:Uncharacterized protein n=1 Tax=Rhodopirellula islandica TaxID=595434 RepID=A0A0J1BF03_RHOIS|nr:hypothetical protein RISK_002924 [Rhodopirellula islandica]
MGFEPVIRTDIRDLTSWKPMPHAFLTAWKPMPLWLALC